MTNTFRLLALLAALLLAGCASGPGTGQVSNLTAELCTTHDTYSRTFEAAKAWHDATGGYVNLTVRIGDDCDTVVKAAQAVRTDDGLPACGLTADDGSLITINVGNPKCTTDDAHVRQTYMHELGHFLTGPSHSLDRKDVMFNTIVGNGTLTDADLARLP